MGEFRLVETGHDADGRAVVRFDGTPARAVTADAGFGVAEHLWLDGVPTTADDGAERAGGGFDLEPPPGGASVRIIRIPPPAPGTTDDERWLRVEGDDPARPGMHTTDTLDGIFVLDGDLVLELDDGEHALSAGDCVIQRGTAHRWRVTGDRPCTYAAVMLRPEADAPSRPAPVAMSAPTALPASDGWRRIVTGAGADGRSHVVAEGGAPSALRVTGTTLAELWQTGGALADPTQGGDPPGDWDLEPRGGGVAFRSVQMPGGHDPGEGGWHTTDTIDVDIVVSGGVALHLPDLDPVELGPGDTVLQRGTHHKWVPLGDEPVHWIAVMWALRH
jgi:quercetin dioxygenase-like cupin family protein